MKQLKKEALLTLLEMYEAAIRELEEMDDRQADGLLRRLERHRAEVSALVAKQDLAPDE